jgi:hypothetical protein
MCFRPRLTLCPLDSAQKHKHWRWKVEHAGGAAEKSDGPKANKVKDESFTLSALEFVTLSGGYSATAAH